MNCTLLLLSCVFVIVVLRRVLRREQVAPLPPGPKGLPVFGNLFQAPSKLLFLKLAEWAKEYGPVYSYNLMGQPVIVLTTAGAAGDILDRMSNKTSDRPRLIKINDYLCRNSEFGFLPRNEVWRAHRRAAHETLNVHAVKAMQPMQEEETLFLIQGLLHHPELSFVDHLHRHASSIAWRGMYGHESIPLEGVNPAAPLDEFFKAIFLAVVPGGSIVDILPALNPLIARTKLLRSQGDRFYEAATAFFIKSFSDEQVEGTSSLSSNLKDNGSKLGLTTAHDCGWLGASLFLAAQDTTATALKWFFLAMLVYPDATQAARVQLKTVVGDHPPTFADRQALPQVDAIVKELLRWRPPTPAGVAHCAAEDFTYGDYMIPKGAIIIPNAWSICRDPLLYTNGEMFDPSRFIDEKGQLKQAQKDAHDDYLVFGHGRRICVGKNLAINSLWISIAYLLWAYDFKKGVDVEGNEVTPDAWDFFDYGATVYPIEFPVVLVPRFADLEERVKVRMAELQTSA